MDNQTAMFSPEEIPQTDEPKKKKLSINILQENLIKLMNRDRVSLSDVQNATEIAWGSLYGYYKGDVTAQLLDINVKELADYFDVSVDFLAFGNPKYKFDTFDREELFKLKDGEPNWSQSG